MNSKFYVSLEAARLLKEKGYDIKRDSMTPVYAGNGCLYWYHGDLSDKIPAITKAEAIDWLESKGIIVIAYYCKGEWLYLITPLLSEIEDRLLKKVFVRETYPTRLEAEDAAIIKALELL